MRADCARKMAFANSDTALAWLYGTQPFGIKLGLDNMRRLLALMQLPPPDLRCIHVAGTNGKGSTCAFIHALVEAAKPGRAGLFTSPHLVRFNERIRDGRSEISDADLARLLGELRPLCAALDPHPTFFEIAYALALRWFEQRGLQWAVLETGLGGRLDATNTITPRVSVITRIGLDHMEILGDTLEKIAAEKAGIIKPGVPVVTGPQAPEAMAVLRQVAAERGAPLLAVTEPWTSTPIGLAGEHQRWNAALAVAATRAAGVDLNAAQTAAALMAARWPGRFEVLAPNLILDGAHNEDSAAALARTWRENFGDRRAYVVFGAAREKAVDAVLRRLVPVAARWHLTAFQSPRATPPDVLRGCLRQIDPQADITCHAGVAEALAAARAARGPCLVCGSLFLVGEARAMLTGGTFERSAQ